MVTALVFMVLPEQWSRAALLVLRPRPRSALRIVCSRDHPHLGVKLSRQRPAEGRIVHSCQLPLAGEVAAP